MIFLLSYKTWEKNKKKLVEPKNYLILDATDDEDAKLSNLTNMVSMDNFSLPMKLLKIVDDDDFTEAIDLDKIEDMEETFFKSLKFKSSVLATMSTFLIDDGDNKGGSINVFIVLRNKAFKYYRKKFKHEFLKIFKEASNCFIIIDGKVKKYTKDLEKDVDDDELEIMVKALKKKEKIMEEEMKEANNKRKKKKKKGWGH